MFDIEQFIIEVSNEESIWNIGKLYSYIGKSFIYQYYNLLYNVYYYTTRIKN